MRMDLFMKTLMEDHLKMVPATKRFDLEFAALALCGEAGELANVVKKEWRDGVDKEEHRLEEAADVLVYLLLLSKLSGWSWSRLLSMAHEKHQKFMAKQNAVVL